MSDEGWSELELLIKPWTTPCGQQASMIKRAGPTPGSFASLESMGPTGLSRRDHSRSCICAPDRERSLALIVRIRQRGRLSGD